MSIIRTEGLIKEFKITQRRPGLSGAIKDLFNAQITTKRAVDNINIEIEEGEIVGYIGPNGAGKSTTIKMLTGILVPTSGTVQVKSYTPWKDRVKYVKEIGIMFGNRTRIWAELPVIESFEMIRYIYEVDKELYARNLRFITEMLEIEELLNRPVRELSLGQKMRCELASIFLYSPSVIFLDEPTIGLDIQAKQKTREVLKKINKELGTTILFTSHDLRDIEDVCERILIINEGRIIFEDKISVLKKSYVSTRRIKILFNEASVLEIDRIQKDIQDKNPGFKINVNSSNKNEVEYIFIAEQVNIPMLVNEILSNFSDVKDIVIEDSKIEDIVSSIFKK